MNEIEFYNLKDNYSFDSESFFFFLLSGGFCSIKKVDDDISTDPTILVVSASLQCGKGTRSGESSCQAISRLLASPLAGEQVVNCVDFPAIRLVGLVCGAVAGECGLAEGGFSGEDLVDIHLFSSISSFNFP